MSIAERATAAASEAPANAQAPDNAIRVLLVDDQLMVGEAIRRALVNEINLEFHYCADPAQAIAVARRVKATVILQDLVMPGVSGLDLVSQYRADPAIRGVPIIVLSTKEEPTIKRDAFKAGANDYLVKLPDQIELVARIRYHSMAYMTQLQRDEAYLALRESQQKLLETNRELERLTNVDGLTGLSNRRYFNEYLGTEWKRCIREGTTLSILMIDVDHFKLYNDTYGHVAGDDVLRKVARTIKAGFRRPADLAARYGGEEFVVILSDTPPAEALRLAESLCQAVEAMAVPHIGSTAGKFVTISVGAATAIPMHGDSFLPLVEEADRALYVSKHAGRNRASARSTGVLSLSPAEQAT